GRRAEVAEGRRSRGASWAGWAMTQTWGVPQGCSPQGGSGGRRAEEGRAMTKAEAKHRITRWAREARPSAEQVRDAWYSEQEGPAQDLADAISVVGLDQA